MEARPDDESPAAEGDRAKERLDEFVRERFPGGLPPEQSPLEGDADADEQEPDEVPCEGQPRPPGSGGD